MKEKNKNWRKAQILFCLSLLRKSKRIIGRTLIDGEKENCGLSCCFKLKQAQRKKREDEVIQTLVLLWEAADLCDLRISLDLGSFGAETSLSCELAVAAADFLDCDLRMMVMAGELFPEAVADLRFWRGPADGLTRGFCLAATCCFLDWLVLDFLAAFTFMSPFLRLLSTLAWVFAFPTVFLFSLAFCLILSLVVLGAAALPGLAFFF